MVEDGDLPGEHDEPINTVQGEDWHEDEMIEALLAEGDYNAIFVADFEAAASEVLQTDDDPSTAYSTYVEARRKLNEKVRARGFWPLGKGKSKMPKGRRPSWNKKSLQQRILESKCRLCGKKGHWKSECPNRPVVPTPPQPRCPWPHRQPAQMPQCLLSFLSFRWSMNQG